jgi:predicted nucleic acid-binding Zn ribbon protein
LDNEDDTEEIEVHTERRIPRRERRRARFGTLAMYIGFIFLVAVMVILAALLLMRWLSGLLERDPRGIVKR